MRLNVNAGGPEKNEPICISAIKSRLRWINYRLSEDSLNSEDFDKFKQILPSRIKITSNLSKILQKNINLAYL